MSDVLNFAEIECQCVELLPARTLLSAFKVAPPDNSPGGGGDNSDEVKSQADATADADNDSQANPGG